MKTVEVKNATDSLGEYARRLAKEPVVVTRRGKPMAALFRVKDTDWETLSLSMNPRFIALIQRSRARHKAKGGIPLAEARRRFKV